MRLITRGDMDGLACAVIFTSYETVSDVLLVHPQDITDDRIEIRDGDVIANLPYHPSGGMWFDHHLMAGPRQEPPPDFVGRYARAPSAAQLIWEHFGEDPRFADLVAETNRLDSAQLTQEDVLDPQHYILLGYTIDSRTGLGAFEEYFQRCLEWIKELPIEEVLRQPIVAERVRRLREADAEFRQALTACSRLDGNVVFTDFRDDSPPPVGNRFLVYVLFPAANVSLRVHWGPDRGFLVAAVGHSIFDRSCRTNVGELLARYGGGGHQGAGSTPLPVAEADAKIAEILEILKSDG
ncbi:MAG: exopolyphosphatase [Thermoanaerobaculia bacterium]